MRNTFELAHAIRGMREHLGWTQRRLAEIAGLSRECIVRVEGWRPHVEAATILKITTALGCELVFTVRRDAREPEEPSPFAAVFERLN